MKSKERPCALTKEGSIHEVKKDHEVPKRRKKKEIKKRKKRKKEDEEEEEDLDLVRLENMQQDEYQGPRTLMCPFEALRSRP